MFRKFSAFYLEIVTPLPPIKKYCNVYEAALEGNITQLYPIYILASTADKLSKNVWNRRYVTMYRMSSLPDQKETMWSWRTIWWDFKEQRFRSFLNQISGVTWWRTMLQPTFKKIYILTNILNWNQSNYRLSNLKHKEN